jgi:hypothetical protein
MVFSKENISDKPYGIVCYRIYFPYPRRTLWVFEEPSEPIWAYYDSSYYKTKEAQRTALFDLTVKYPNYKFLVFSNKGKHPMEIYGETIRLKDGF